MTTPYNRDNEVTTPIKGGENMERVRAGLRIPYELNTKLILEARKMGISKNALILQMLKREIDNLLNKDEETQHKAGRGE